MLGEIFWRYTDSVTRPWQGFKSGFLPFIIVMRTLNNCTKMNHYLKCQPTNHLLKSWSIAFKIFIKYFIKCNLFPNQLSTMPCLIWWRFRVFYKNGLAELKVLKIVWLNPWKQNIVLKSKFLTSLLLFYPILKSMPKFTNFDGYFFNLEFANISKDIIEHHKYIESFFRFEK